MLTDTLNLAVDHLKDHVALQTADIFHEEDQTLVTKVKRALGAGMGAFLLVRFSALKSNSPDCPGPHMEEGQLQVVAYESPLINRASAEHKTALQLAEIAGITLHWPNDPQSARLQQLCTTFDRMQSRSRDGLLIWEVTFNFNPTLQKD